MGRIEPPQPEDRPDDPANEEASNQDLASRRFDAWRRRSAIGGMATGMALGLQEIFYPNKNEPVLTAEAPGDPPDADERLRVILDPDDPTKSVAILPRADDPDGPTASTPG